jgi:hypothetical protein
MNVGTPTVAELKVNVEPNQGSPRHVLAGLTSPGPSTKVTNRLIWFMDGFPAEDETPGPWLLSRGLIIRLRLGEGTEGDLTVKVRGPWGGLDATKWLNQMYGTPGDARWEGDWTHHRRLVSASLKLDLAECGLSPTPQQLPTEFPGQLSAVLGSWLVPRIESLQWFGPVTAASSGDGSEERGRRDQSGKVGTPGTHSVARNVRSGQVRPRHASATD